MNGPELGFCKCGQPAEIAIEVGNRRSVFCGPCWERKTATLLSDLKKIILRKKGRPVGSTWEDLQEN